MLSICSALVTEHVAGLVGYELLLVIWQRSRGLSNRAAIGDLYANDPTSYASLTAVKELMTPVRRASHFFFVSQNARSQTGRGQVMKMVVPIVGGLLSRIDLYLPFKVSAAVAALNMLTPLLYNEPLRPHQRLPFK